MSALVVRVSPVSLFPTNTNPLSNSTLNPIFVWHTCTAVNSPLQEPPLSHPHTDRCDESTGNDKPSFRG